MPATADPMNVAQRRNARTAAASGFFGTTLEYYDFVIYGTAAALYFGTVFFPNHSMGTLLALGSFAVAYAARPVGAVVWGQVGDRLGRKTTLLTILLTMGIATFLVGCIPGYSVIGPAAPVILVILRVIQGMSAGGEQAGSALVAMEHAPDRRRAFYTSWTLGGSNFGNFIATMVFLALAAILPDKEMLAWGWRVPFWVSALVIALTFIVRRRLAEPGTMQKLKQEGLAVKVPIVEVVRHHWGSALLVTVGSACIALNSLFNVFGLAYATSALHLQRSLMLVLIAGASLIMIATQPLFAILSDRIGRKPVFLAGLAGCAVLTPVWLASLYDRDWVLIFVSGLTLMCAFWAMVTGVLIATFLEMFPASVRFTGMAVSNMLGIVVAGFIPVIAQSFVQYNPGNWVPIAWLNAGILVASGIAVLLGPENFRVPTSALGLGRNAAITTTVPVCGAAQLAHERPAGNPQP
jgi:MFS family permease